LNSLKLFGRHRNLAITSSAIPQIIEGIQSLDVVRIEGSESLDIGTWCISCDWVGRTDAIRWGTSCDYAICPLTGFGRCIHPDLKPTEIYILKGDKMPGQSYAQMGVKNPETIYWEWVKPAPEPQA